MLHPVTDRRVDKLIHLLVKNATVVVPGPKIASQIGVTRSTVWMYIEKLRSLGVEIKGHHSSGYQLRTLPDILAPSLIRTELGENEIGHKIVHYFRIESTNDVALALAAQGAEHGTVVLAEEQTPAAAASGARGSPKNPAASTFPLSFGLTFLRPLHPLSRCWPALRRIAPSRPPPAWPLTFDGRTTCW